MRWLPAIWRGDPRKPHLPLRLRLRLPHVKAAARRDAPASAARLGNRAARNALRDPGIDQPRGSVFSISFRRAALCLLHGVVDFFMVAVARQSVVYR